MFKSKIRSKLTGHQICNAASCGVFDPRGSRQMDMQACPLGSLLAGIKQIVSGLQRMSETLKEERKRNK